MKFIYGDIRDLKILKVKDNSIPKFEIPVLIKQNERLLYFYNSLGNCFFSKNTTINYLKITHIIKGKDAYVYEIYNLKRNQTACIPLRKPISNEIEELYITLVTDKRPVFSKNLTSLYLKSNKIIKRSYDHFYFKKGKINRISIYPFFIIYNLVIYIIVILLTLIVVVTICI